MDKVEKLRAIDATWAKLDDLFDPESGEDDRQAYLDEFKEREGFYPSSEFTIRYPETSDYLRKQAKNEIYQYCLAVGRHRLEMLCSVPDDRTPVAVFWRTTPAHRVLGHLLCCRALKNFSEGSDHIGVEVGVAKKAMSIYVSDRTSAAILAEAEDRGYINRVMASWNRRIPLVFATPATISDWVYVQLMEWYQGAVTSGLRDAYKELDSVTSGNKSAVPQFIDELERFSRATIEETMDWKKKLQ